MRQGSAGTRKYLRGNILAVGVFLVISFVGTVSGFAATLPHGSQTLLSGSQTVSACQLGAISVSFDTAYDSQIRAYAVTGVRLAGLESGCAGGSLQVALADSAGSPLLVQTGTVPTSGSTMSFDVSAAHVSAAAVVAVHMSITG